MALADTLNSSEGLTAGGLGATRALAAMEIGWATDALGRSGVTGFGLISGFGLTCGGDTLTKDCLGA